MELIVDPSTALLYAHLEHKEFILREDLRSPQQDTQHTQGAHKITLAKNYGTPPPLHAVALQGEEVTLKTLYLEPLYSLTSARTLFGRSPSPCAAT